MHDSFVDYDAAVSSGCQKPLWDGSEGPHPAVKPECPAPRRIEEFTKASPALARESLPASSGLPRRPARVGWDVLQSRVFLHASPAPRAPKRESQPRGRLGEAQSDPQA